MGLEVGGVSDDVLKRHLNVFGIIELHSIIRLRI